jgi:quercetin dioxygenase-like cupin family protein
MKYLRKLDLPALTLAGADARVTQVLAEAATGTQRVSMQVVRLPAGGESPAGRHRHTFEKLFYVLAGTMAVEIDGEEVHAGPGSVVVVPEGVPHRNWNAGKEPVLHLVVMSPNPDFTKPLGIPV